jgi:hypothetical protein
MTPVLETEAEDNGRQNLISRQWEWNEHDSDHTFYVTSRYRTAQVSLINVNKEDTLQRDRSIETGAKDFFSLSFIDRYFFLSFLYGAIIG